MSQENVPVEIIIQGRSHEMVCPENESDSLREAAQLLNDKIEAAKQKTANNEKATILAALHIAHELLNARHAHSEQLESQNTVANEQIQHLINNIYHSIQKKEN